MIDPNSSARPEASVAEPGESAARKREPLRLMSEGEPPGDGAANERPGNELERLRRWSNGLDKLMQASLGAESFEAMAQRMLELFHDLARADSSVARLREGDRCVAKASIGLEEEVAARTSIAMAESFPPGAESGGLAICTAAEPCAGELMPRKGVVELCVVPLSHQGESLGALYLGARKTAALSSEDQQLLAALAPRAAQALARQRRHEKAQAALRLQQDVLGVVAHDLRNPLNVITLAANVLLARLPDSSMRRPVERIIRGAERATRLVQDLLAIDAIDGGRFAIEKRRVETADTILASLESQQALAANASIIFATDLSPGLPAIEVDEERVLEVLENLVGNAVKFTSPGGQITVGASARDAEILFWVSDNGQGISPDDLPYLFDRFFQAKKKDRRGTGLGLTICKAIVEAHGGRIWAESQLKRGTTVYFTIPSMLENEGTRAPQPVANLLIVDDRPENILSLKAILERPEYRLLTATSGEEALRLALREVFDVALIDIAMPGMNGLEVAQHLKDLERSRNTPIIFITAFGDDPQEIHRAYSAGGADYLVKPLDSEIVRKKVAVFVDLSQRRQQSARDGEPIP